MGFLGIGKKELSLEELQEINEKREVQLSVAQKEAAIKKLKDAGLTKQSFGNSWSAIWDWVKKH